MTEELRRRGGQITQWTKTTVGPGGLGVGTSGVFFEIAAQNDWVVLSPLSVTTVGMILGYALSFVIKSRRINA